MNYDKQTADRLIAEASDAFHRHELTYWEFLIKLQNIHMWSVFSQPEKDAA